MLVGASTLPAPSPAMAAELPEATQHKLRQQATDFESVFLNTLFKEMFSSVKTDQSAMGGGFAEETWRGIQAERMADAVAADGGLGIADAIYSDLIAAQLQAAPPSPPAFSTTGYAK